jgi:hypothetical protein
MCILIQIYFKEQVLSRKKNPSSLTMALEKEEERDEILLC